MKFTDTLKNILKEFDVIIGGALALTPYEEKEQFLKKLGIKKIYYIECYIKGNFEIAIQDICNRLDMEKIKYKTTVSEMEFLPRFIVDKTVNFDFGRREAIKIAPIRVLKEQVGMVDFLAGIVPFYKYYIINADGIKILEPHLAIRILAMRKNLERSGESKTSSEDFDFRKKSFTDIFDKYFGK